MPVGSSPNASVSCNTRQFRTGSCALSVERLLVVWFSLIHPSRISVTFYQKGPTNICVYNSPDTVSGISVTYILCKLLLQDGILKHNVQLLQACSVFVEEVLSRLEALYGPYISSQCDWLKALPLVGCSCSLPELKTF